MADLREAVPVQLRQSAAACRTADAESVLSRLVRDLAPHLVVAPATDHVPTAAQIEKPMAVLLSLLRPGWAREIARLVCPGLCRVQTARAIDLRAVPMAVVLCPHELVRRVDRPQTAKATRVLRLPRALLLRRVVAARPAWLSPARPVTANRLMRVPVLHREPRDRLCRAVQAWPPDRYLRPLDLSLEPSPDCHPRARRRELAAEHLLDFRL